MSKELTVIVPVRNRSGRRLNNNLATLSQQTLLRDNYDIVVVDYGSDDDHKASIKELCEHYRVQAISVQGNKIWNKSHALNIALRKINTRYTMSTDVDMVYREDFLEWVLLSLARKNSFVSCQCKYLNEHYSKTLTVPIYWESAEMASGPLSKSGAVGACFAMSTQWLRSVGGWDEAYQGWGREDMDIVTRAKFSGYQQVWISDKTMFYHQYHDDVAAKKDLHLMQENDIRFNKLCVEKQIAQRNGEYWGLVKEPIHV